ncbi:hypothetical protein HA402_006619 [Bradysia odoriphaga]|nr:hypothetical protein HA402_006619 [Bradysia odoriphaga]
MTKHLSYPNRMCRVCETTGQLTDLTEEASKSMVKKLRAVADISFDVKDELPKGLCKKCCENLDRAYKFKIQCEYTEQKLRDALAECQTERFTEYVSTTATGNNDVELKTECDENIVDVLEDTVQSQDTDIYQETSSIISKEEHLIDADDSMSQSSANDSQLISVDVGEDSEVNVYYGDVERLEEDEQYGDMGEVLEGEIGEFAPIDDVEYVYDEAEIEFLENENDHDKSVNCQKVETRPRTRPQKTNKSNSRNPETDKFHCDTCGAPFEKYNDLNEHKKTHGNQRYQCPTCSRWFSKKYHMKNHQTIHLNQKLFACTLCTKKYTNQGNLDRHVRVFHHNEKQYQCEVCQKCFSQSSILRAHLHVHNEERNYECNVCHQRYKTIDYLNSHKKRHLPPEQRNFKKYPKKKSTSNAMKKCYVCSQCGKKSNSVALHKSHTRTHTGEKPYSCSHCQKTFAFKQSLRSHILVHTGSKPYTCNICFAQFRQIGHLNGHSLVHSGVKKHKCKVCDKSFALRGNLTVHQRLHTGETPYHCQHCPKKFYDSNGLKRHNQIHERNKGNRGSVTQEVESSSMITELSDIILTEEGVDGSQSDQLESKILIDSNGQHYKIEMPPETESDIRGKIDSGNFYKMNYVDGGATIWVSENNLND